LAVGFVGAGVEHERLLWRLAHEAIRKYGFEGDLTISVKAPPDEPAEADAGANNELIWFRPEFLEHASPATAEGDGL
jgi:hypothetical protein